MSERASRQEIIDAMKGVRNGMRVSGPPLPPSPPNATSVPMEPWQQSVEARLKSLDDRLGRIEPDIATLKTDVAVIKATMATKDDLRGLKDDMYGLERAIGARMQKYLAVAGGLIVIATAASTWAAKLIH